MYLSVSVVCLSLAFLAYSASTSLEVVGEAAAASFASASEDRERVVQQAARAGEVASDLAAYVAAMSLTEAGALSPTDASKIATSAIDNLGKESERWKLLAKAFNDLVLRNLEFDESN
jgi:hypothetical protein